MHTRMFRNRLKLEKSYACLYLAGTYAGNYATMSMSHCDMRCDAVRCHNLRQIWPNKTQLDERDTHLNMLIKLHAVSTISC